MEFKHHSVLLDASIEGLNIKMDGIYVDGTLGGAGHAYEICKRINSKGLLIGIDQDQTAIEASSNRLSEFKDKISLHRANYSEINLVLKELGIPRVDGILLDLGVSSYQLDCADRGFSYRQNAGLDMRMDQRKTITAKDIINTYSQDALAKMIRNYSEEKWASRIAQFIIKNRKSKPIETTFELVDIIKQAIPAKARQKGGHPAKRTFQAIRIELNDELNVLTNTLNTMIDLLNDNGRLCVITFHSLEDRIVKRNFKQNEDPCTCPKDFPICVCGKKSKGKMITRKPIIPSQEEKNNNSRAKSAKLRIFKKISG